MANDFQSLPPGEPPPAIPALIDYHSSVNAPSKAGIVVIGVLLIVFGAGAGCIGASVPLISLIPNVQVQQEMGSLIMATLLYLCISAALVTLGVGACRAKRWVRPLIVALGWPAVIVGAVGLASFLLNISEFMSLMSAPPGGAGPTLPASVRIISVVSIVLFQGVLMVGTPLAIVLYIRRPKTEEILSYYDARKNWTDACPQQVLTWAMALGASALMMLLALARPLLPMPGGILSGIPAAALIFAVAAGLMWIAYGSYRLKMPAWWASLIVSVLGGLWWMTLVTTGSLDQYWRAISADEQQAALMQRTSGGTSSLLAAVVMLVITVAFVLSIRKHFTGKSPEGATAAASA